MLEIEGQSKHRLMSPAMGRASFQSPASSRRLNLPKMMSTSKIALMFVNLVIPTVSQNFFGLLLHISNLYYIGLLGDAALTAGYGLATSLCHVLGLSLFIGTNCA